MIRQRFCASRAPVRALQCVLVAAAILSGAVVAGSPSPAGANSKYAAIVIDARQNKTLFSRSADRRRYPASLTKVMTLYIVFQEMDAGRLSLDSRITISRRAAGQAPSRLGLKRGSTFPLRLAIPALVVKSANDVATAVAEHIGDTETKFARRMTATARSIGMTRTQFKNASGLPNSSQYTTARDMAKLAQRLQTDFPHYYHYFKTGKFRWNNRTYRNHNTLLRKFGGTDGVKTGYTRASGFNLVSSVHRDGKHLIAVVLGGKSAKSRDRHMISLLKRQFPKASRYKAPPLAYVPLPLEPFRVTVAAITDTPDPAPAPAPATTVVAAKSPPPIPQPPPVADQGSQQPPPSSDAEAWSIQVGAYKRQKDASAWLDKVAEKKPDILKISRPITILTPSASGKQLLYRARFTGIPAKKQARSACRSFKKIGVDCITISPD